MGIFVSQMRFQRRLRILCDRCGNRIAYQFSIFSLEDEVFAIVDLAIILEIHRDVGVILLTKE